MASRTGIVIQFPQQIAAPSCFRCIHFADHGDANGVTSFCTALSEDIHDETVAEECPEWEE